MLIGHRTNGIKYHHGVTEWGQRPHMFIAIENEAIIKTRLYDGGQRPHIRRSPRWGPKKRYLRHFVFPRVETRGYKHLAPLGPRVAMFEDRALSI